MSDQYTVQEDKDDPTKWRACLNGVAIGVAGTYQEIEDYLDLLEQGEK